MDVPPFGEVTQALSTVLVKNVSVFSASDTLKLIDTSQFKLQVCITITASARVAINKYSASGHERIQHLSVRFDIQAE